VLYRKVVTAGGKDIAGYTLIPNAVVDCKTLQTKILRMRLVPYFGFGHHEGCFVASSASATRAMMVVGIAEVLMLAFVENASAAAGRLMLWKAYDYGHSAGIYFGLQISHNAPQDPQLAGEMPEHFAEKRPSENRGLCSQR
jgi:hypothetical protein